MSEEELQAVLPLCEKIGFGRVMQIASEEWKRRDPVGALTIGPCFGSVDNPKNEQLTWPLAAVMIGLVLVACLFVVGMNLSTALMVSCR